MTNQDKIQDALIQAQEELFPASTSIITTKAVSIEEYHTHVV
jgi:hypothetical protein